MEYSIDDHCVNWIKENEFNSVAIQLDSVSTQQSVNLLLSFQSRLPLVNFYLIVSDSCSIDLLSIQHLGLNRVDGLIKFGDTCLAPIPRDLDKLPVLFNFGYSIDDQLEAFTCDTISKLKSEQSIDGDGDGDGKWLILYSSNHIELVKRLCSKLSWLQPGKLLSLSFNWDFNEIHCDLIHKDVNSLPDTYFGAFQIPDKLISYSKIVYIGEQINLNLRLTPGLIHIDPVNRLVEIRRGQKELSKRIGLIERLKAKPLVNLGFLFTNSFPEVDDFMEKIDSIKRKNHLISKIILIHSTDECKLGNFTNLDAFVLVNGCSCTKLIDKLDLHLPILIYKEYEILCGCKVNYGGVDWNQESGLLSEDDEPNESDNHLVSDSVNQLIESQILNQDKWYGLTINPAYQPISHVKQGQTGKASGYTNEPI